MIWLASHALVSAADAIGMCVAIGTWNGAGVQMTAAPNSPVATAFCQSVVVAVP